MHLHIDGQRFEAGKERRLAQRSERSDRLVEFTARTYHSPVEETPEQRAARRRATWAGVVTRDATLAGPASPLHRASVTEMLDLSTRAWLLAGRTLPSYSRSEAPGRVLRPWRT